MKVNWFVRLVRKWDSGFWRVSHQAPDDRLPCEWCKEVKLTSVGEVWSGVDPDGYLVRLCQECTESCAGG